MKTINNMFNSSRREIVIDAADAHYDTLCKLIESLIDSEDGIELKLTLKFRDVSVELNVNETLIVINTLAVKRRTAVCCSGTNGVTSCRTLTYVCRSDKLRLVLNGGYAKNHPVRLNGTAVCCNGNKQRNIVQNLNMDM